MKLKKFYLFVVVINFLILSSTLYADKIYNIEITGNNRISKEYILSLLSLKTGEDYNSMKSAYDIRSLYDTDLFTDIKVDFKNNILHISISENPLLVDVNFEGNTALKSNILLKEMISQPKSTFTESKIKADIQKIINLYINKGYLNTKVSYIKKIHNNNMVSLNINIIEGNKTRISNITFQGNKYFSQSVLESIIFTKKHNWYSFLTNTDIYDKNKLFYDSELLKNFYLENGFPNFTLITATTTFSPVYGDFRIMYLINEGDRYKLGEQSVYIKIPEIISLENKLNRLVTTKNNTWFSISFIEEQVRKIKKLIKSVGFQFVDVTPVYTYSDILKTVDVSFVISSEKRLFINRIDIYGNKKTIDPVIRRELKMKEGDAFTIDDELTSTRNLNKTGYFSSAIIEKQPLKDKNEINLAVNVVEKSTITLMASGAYNPYEKLLLNLSYSNHNFLGRGIKTSVDLSFAQLSNNYSFSISDPYFLNTNIYFGVHLYQKEQGNKALLGNTLKGLGNTNLLYNLQEQGATVSLGYYLNNYLKHNIYYSLSFRRIDNMNPNASMSIKELEGTKLLSSITNIFSFDTTDSIYYPTSGWDISLSEEISGVGGDVAYLKSIFKTIYYKEIFTEKLIMSALFSAANITSLKNQKILLIDKFRLGAETLRGFVIDLTKYGVGPLAKDTFDALGGDNMLRASLQVDYPILGVNDLSLTGHVFNDWGTVTDFQKYPNTIDSGKIRSSIGFGITWRSPIGTMSFNFGWPIIKDKYDQTQVFLFSLGARI